MQRGFSLILIHIYVSLSPKIKNNNCEMEFRFQASMILIISVVLIRNFTLVIFLLKALKEGKKKTLLLKTSILLFKYIGWPALNKLPHRYEAFAIAFVFIEMYGNIHKWEKNEMETVFTNIKVNTISTNRKHNVVLKLA